MEIPAHFDERRNIRIPIKLIGTCDELAVNSLFDTGFSGNVACPISVACAIGLKPQGVGSVQLADGSVVTMPVFIGKVKIGNNIIDTTYLVLSEETKECLVGMDLMSPYEINFLAAEKKVAITEEGNMHSLSELKQSLRRIVPR